MLVQSYLLSTSISFMYLMGWVGNYHWGDDCEGLVLCEISNLMCSYSFA